MSRLLNVTEVLAQASKATLHEYALLEHEPRNMGGADGINDIVGTLRCGLQAHYMSDGAWSHHQLIAALLQLSGPAAVYLSSYAMSENAARMLSEAMSSGNVTQLHAVIDNRIETRTAGSLQLLQSIATQCALLPCHAKVTAICGAEWNIVVMGSANYTENKRIETGVAIVSEAAVRFHANWILQQIKKNGQ